MKKQCVLLAALAIACGAPAGLTDSQTPVGFAAAAQSSRVTGVVRDANGETLPGATVTVKGTKTTTATDLDGRYSIAAPQGSTLVITYIGYKAREVRVSGSMMDVNLEAGDNVLDDLVVVGYGTQRRENLTGAVSSVDVNKTLRGRQIPDVGRGLQGTTPGLNITLPDAEVGSDATIRVRGQVASLNGSAQPLILLDNVEIPSIQILNPDDIESISVLKDAAASSIYGSKAAFGVVLITSKKGANTDRVNISYQGNFAWQNISKKMEMAGVDGIAYRVDALKRAGGTLAGAFFYIDEASLAAAREWDKQYGGSIGKDDPFVYGRDWYVDANGRKFSKRIFDPYDYMIREWAPSMTHTVSINGKAGKTTFNVGLGYLDQKGLIKPAKKDDFRRYNGSLRLSTEFNKYLTTRVGATYSLRNKRYAYATNSTTADPWLYLYRWDTTYPLGYDEHGNLIRSPYSEMKAANTANKENSYLSFNVGFTLNFTKNWKLDLDYTYASENQDWNKIGTKFTMANSWTAPVLRKDADGNQIYVNSNGDVVSADTEGAMPAYDLNVMQYTSNGSNPDHIRREVTHDKRHTLNITTNYNWQVNDANNLKFMLGMNRTDWESKNEWGQITNLTDIVSPSWDKTVGTQTTSGNLYWEGQLGFFGRINYNLLDRYLFEANLRYDGTSKFPKNLRWRWYPSFSAGWLISNEPFMESLKPTLSMMKIRGSWGMIGDQSVSNSLYVATMTQSQSNWLDGASKLVTVGTPSAVQANIKWQDIITTDVGFDARFFNNELGVTFDWYQRQTKNMLVPGEGIPGTFGAAAPTGNYGNLRTRGWEIAIDYNHRFENGLAINLMATLSDAKTTITKYGTATNIDGWYDGKEYGELWGYQFDRLYQKDDFVYDGEGNLVTTYALNGKEVEAGTAGAKIVNKLADPNGIYQDYFQSGTFRFGPGDVKFRDTNNDGQINNGKNSTSDHGDLTRIGNTTPRFEYGFRVGLEYKGFDFSMFWQGIGKRRVWGYGFLAIPGFNTGDGSMPQAIAKDYWTEDNTDAFYPRPQNMGGSNAGYNMQVSDRYSLNMSYIRLKNITLGYTLPADLTRKALIQRARIYIAAENLFTIDKLRGLPIDPEVVSGISMWNNGNYNMGRTGVGTPAMKNFSVGIQLNF